MKALRRAAVAVAAAATMFAAPTLTAHAITGGEPDGNQHPNVGMILFYEADGRYRCTATLVSPTVLLTAAHCTAPTVGKTIVTFNTVIAYQPPSGVPAAANPAVGYVAADIASRPDYYIGTPHTHPQYSDFKDLANWNDVGVIVLDRPVTGIAPASVAPLGTLDTIGRPNLAHTTVRIVGYGTEVRKPDVGPQKPTPQSFPLLRRYADAPGQKLTPQILQVNGNPNDTRGTGGSCFGDSGGPSFYKGAVVTVTSYGRTDNCRYIGGLQRVDIAGVASWLATFGVRA